MKSYSVLALSEKQREAFEFLPVEIYVGLMLGFMIVEKSHNFGPRLTWTLTLRSNVCADDKCEGPQQSSVHKRHTRTVKSSCLKAPTILMSRGL